MCVFTGKKYKSKEEEAKRKKIWLECRTRVIEHNKKYDSGESTFECGLNQMSDLVCYHLHQVILLLSDITRIC